MGGSTYLLNDERDGTLFNIRSGNSQRHPFGEGVHTDDDKMSGSAASRNERSFNNELRYIFREKSLA